MDVHGEQISYKVKTIDFMNRRVPIMMQNENGPCPLLALANVLLLRNRITLSSSTNSVTQVGSCSVQSLQRGYWVGKRWGGDSYISACI